MRILVSFSDCLTARSSQHLPVKKFTCMRVSVSQQTPNTMIYGELGRCPLYINMVMKAFKYWLNLVEPSDNRLPKAASETVKSLDDKGVKIWASDTRTCLFQYGFGIVYGVHSKWKTKRVSYKSQSNALQIVIYRTGTTKSPKKRRKI